MPDVDVLRELTGQFGRPQFDDLVSVARKRRRSVVLGAAAGVAVVVLAVGVATAALSDGQRASEPIQQPSPTQIEPSRPATPTTSDGWTLERIRAEGSPQGDVFDYRLGPAPGSFLDAELYCVGGEGCDDFPPDLEGRTSHFALEMTERAEGGRSALFEVQGRPWAKYFDEDSMLVHDGFAGAERFRLLQTDGTELQLRLVSDPAPAAPGPDVMLIQDLDRARDFQVGPEGPGIEPYLVDDRAATLQPLLVPEEIKQWGPNVAEFLWGTNDCRVMWQQRDGGFDHHDVDCRNPGLTDLPDDYWGYLDDVWTEPGRMVVLEHNADGIPLVVHASLDRGATWERIEVEDRDRGETTAVIADALEDALRELD
jgi:hypothetical protein